MKNSRRQFISLSIKTGIALPFIANGLMSCSSEETSTTKKLNILILGGTSFLGPHQIAYALGRGHSVSTFTRGKTRPTIHKELFDEVEELIGDRNDDLSALENRKWDVVIDNSGHKVEWTKKTAAMLKDSCELYLYTSSTGVFYPYINSEFKETSEVLLIEPDVIVDEEEKLEYWYGVMKANSELAALAEFGEERTIIVRPTYMIGPADKIDRFIHWPIRLSRGGEVLVPGKATDMVQYADVRDIAEWMIRLIETKNTGTYNAAGPAEQQNVYSFVEEAQKAFDVENTLIKIDDYDFLMENDISQVVPWIIPVGKNLGSSLIHNAKAKANGLTFRPIANSVKDTFQWWNSKAISQEQRDAFELDPKGLLLREKAIIEKWKAL